MATTTVQPLTAASFKAAVLDAEGPVLVDFQAGWCAPCRAQAPILDQLAGDHAGSARVYSVDVDAEPELANLMQIRALPSLLVFHGGAIRRRFTGLTDRATLSGALAAA